MPSSLLRPKQEGRSNATQRPTFPLGGSRAVNCCSRIPRVAMHPGSASVRGRQVAKMVEVVRPARIVNNARDRGRGAGRGVRVELSFAQCPPWRAEQLGGSDTRWAADAVGQYEVTARWLLENIISTTTVERVFVCGTSELTLALCADLTRRKLEYDYYSAPGETALPALTLVGADAEEYLQDHEFHRQQVGFVSTGPTIDAEPQQPTVSFLMRLIGEQNGPTNAVIFVDDKAHGPSTARSTGTRLAARFPTMPIYIWDNDAQMAEDPLPIVGRLRTYRLALDIPEGQAQDVWERAAKPAQQIITVWRPCTSAICRLDDV
jgi:hypothetical protein